MKIPIWVRRWNKKIHIYLGLYMLLFLWLFSISGLFINHHNWFERPPQPVQVKWEKPIELPQGADDQAKAEDLRAQLGLSGRFSGPGATESLLPVISLLSWWVSTR